MKLEQIVGGIKKGVIAGALLYSTYSGAMRGVDAYMSRLDQPTLIARQEVRVEQLRDGRIHIYEAMEKHQYLPPPALMQQAPKQPPAEPRPKSLPEQQREHDNPTRLAQGPSLEDRAFN